MIFHVNLCCSPLAQFHYRSPEEGQVARAKVLTEDLLQVVRSEHAKMQTILHQQQMELHQAQAQYAAYSAMAVGSFFFFSSPVLSCLWARAVFDSNRVSYPNLFYGTCYLGLRPAAPFKCPTSTSTGRSTTPTPRWKWCTAICQRVRSKPGTASCWNRCRITGRIRSILVSINIITVLLLK